MAKEGQTKRKQFSKQERKHEPRKDRPLAKAERIRALGIGISIALEVGNGNKVHVEPKRWKGLSPYHRVQRTYEKPRAPMETVK